MGPQRHKKTAFVPLGSLFVLFVFLPCFVAWSLPQTREVSLRQIAVASEEEAKQVRDHMLSGTAFENGATYLSHVRPSELRNEVREAIDSLAPGEISKPVRSGNTYLLFQVVPEAEARWIDLDEAGAKALTVGRTAEAISDFEHALAQAEASALGNAPVARSLGSLADVYRLDGRNAEAEKLYSRALGVLEKMGAPDLEIAQVLNSLGMALVKQRRFNEAEPIYTRARTIREKRLGPDHPEVAATLQNIAELFAGLGRFVDAAKLYEQSQALLERTLGSSHPAALAGAENLQAFRRSLLPELLDRFSKALILSEIRDEQFAQTIAEIHELLPLAPLSEYSFVQMKKILMESGLIAETEGVLRVGLNKFPNSRILQIYLADALAETGRTRIAVDVLEEANRLSRPPALDASTNRQQLAIIQERLGDLHLALANVDTAVGAYQRAIELDPTASGVRLKLGKAYFSNSRLEEARTEFERVIAQMPDNTEARVSLAEVHLTAGRWERAAEAAESAIKLGASDSRPLYLLGTALIRMGRTEQGQDRLREFARVEADLESAKSRAREIDAVNAAAIEALRAGSGEAAIRHLTEAIQRYPDDGRLQMTLAIVQGRLNRHQMAIDTLESMLEHRTAPGFLVHKNLADEYELIGNLEASRRHRTIYLDTRETELLLDVQK
jgi:tetratricopeptide (TPR) repeat protein